MQLNVWKKEERCVRAANNNFVSVDGAWRFFLMIIYVLLEEEPHRIPFFPSYSFLRVNFCQFLWWGVEVRLLSYWYAYKRRKLSTIRFVIYPTYVFRVTALETIGEMVICKFFFYSEDFFFRPRATIIKSVSLPNLTFIYKRITLSTYWNYQQILFCFVYDIEINLLFF